MKIGRLDIFEAFISGGRDSALSAYIAYKTAKALGKPFTLVYIDTGTGLEETREYVVKYADWLGAELKILKTRYDYWTLVDKYGYPFLWNHRWCIDYLKLEPVMEHLLQLYREDVKPLWIMGMRRGESRFRLSRYRKIIYQHSYRRRDGIVLNTWIWLPILNLPSYLVDKLLHRHGIPRNPVWNRLGISGECLCLAGSTKKLLDLLAIYYPEKARELIERDMWIQSRRRTREGYPPPLYNDRVTLSEYLRKRLNTKTLDIFVTYQGKCQCILERGVSNGG